MTRPLPELLARIAEAAGEDAAMAMAREYGGRRVYIPARPRCKSGRVQSLARVVGEDACRRIAETIGYGWVWVPFGPWRPRGASRPYDVLDRVVASLESGMKPSAAAREAGCSERWAHVVKAWLRSGRRGVVYPTRRR